jgi:hypothetical protein
MRRSFTYLPQVLHAILQCLLITGLIIHSTAPKVIYLALGWGNLS